MKSAAKPRVVISVWGSCREVDGTSRSSRSNGCPIGVHGLELLVFFDVHVSVCMYFRVCVRVRACGCIVDVDA